MVVCRRIVDRYHPLTTHCGTPLVHRRPGFQNSARACHPTTRPLLQQCYIAVWTVLLLRYKPQSFTLCWSNVNDWACLQGLGRNGLLGIVCNCTTWLHWVAPARSGQHHVRRVRPPAQHLRDSDVLACASLSRHPSVSALRPSYTRQMSENIIFCCRTTYGLATASFNKDGVVCSLTVWCPVWPVTHTMISIIV